MEEPGGAPIGAGFAPQPGQRISHYEIREKLGEGGMGVVYRAVDLRLDRQVALKLLPPEKMADPRRRGRFVAEAKAASALNHPNIVTIHEIETVDGTDFIAMEYLPGRTLLEALAAGPLPVEAALDCAIQVAEALAAAHRAGIVHRDIKPANIMMAPSGLVKLLDFGLAKPVHSEDPGEFADTRTMHTSVGEVVGTVAYMSPEQVQGLAVDARSDIFSFGAVLFQMLSGAMPFQGANTLERMYAVAHAPAPSLRRIRPDAPEALVEIVERMLEKNPARRPQTMEEVLAGLRVCLAHWPGGALKPARARRWRPSRRFAIVAAVCLLALAAVARLPLSRRWPGAIPKEKKIAVLPFRNVGDHAENQAFCDGVMETVSSSLTQMEQFHGSLWVVPASEVRRESVASAHDAARALGANLVITGSVQRQGDSVRLTTDLVDAGTLQQLRSRQVSRSMSEISELQDWVIQAAADMLDVELRPQARQALAGGSTTASAAYDLYLQAEGHLQRRAKGDTERSIDLFKQAIAQDPNYAQAYDGLAEAYWRLYRTTSDTQWVEPARENSRRALALNDRMPSAYRTMGMIESGSGRQDSGMRALERSMALDPASAATHIEMGTAYEAMGRPDDAEKSYLKATELHPSDWSSLNYLALFYYRRGRYAEAEALFHRGLELAPDNNSLYTNLGAAYWMGGQLEEAARSFEKSLALRPSASAYSNLGTVYYFQGRCREAAPLVEKAVELQPKSNDLWANLADAYSCLGAADKAANAYGKASALVRELLSVNPADPEALSSLGLYQARVGDRGKALALAEKAQSLAPANRTVQWHAALSYELCGRRERALQALGSALRLGQPLNEVRTEPALAALRADARYGGLTREK
jgi:serine/threonine-protein kinase